MGRIRPEDFPDSNWDKVKGGLGKFAKAPSARVALLSLGGLAGLWAHGRFREQPIVPDAFSLDNPAGPIRVVLLVLAEHQDLDVDTAILADGHGGKTAVGASAGLDVGETGFAAGNWRLEKTAEALVAKFVPKHPEETVNPERVYYLVHGNNDLPSNLGRITASYQAAATVDGAPLASPILVKPDFGAVTIHVISRVQAGAAPLDPESLQIRAPGGTFATTLKVPNEGEWRVDTASGTFTFTFTPDQALTGNPTPILFTISASNGQSSKERQIAIEYAGRSAPRDMPETGPVARNVVEESFDYAIDGEALPGGGTKRGVEVTVAPDFVVAMGKDIDPGSILLVATLTAPGQDSPGISFKGTQRDAADKILGFKQVAIDGEGVWRVTATGSVVFEPDQGFDKPPTAIYYTIADVDGNRSNVALIILSKALGEGLETLRGTVREQSEDFWNDYLEIVNDVDINNLASLQRLYALTAVAESVLFQSFTPAAKARAAARRPAQLPAEILGPWKLQGDPTAFYQLTERYVDGLKLTDDADGLLARYLRLNLMKRVWPLFFAMLDRLMENARNGRG